MITNDNIHFILLGQVCQSKHCQLWTRPVLCQGNKKAFLMQFHAHHTSYQTLFPASASNNLKSPRNLGTWRGQHKACGPAHNVKFQPMKHIHMLKTIKGVHNQMLTCTNMYIHMYVQCYPTKAHCSQLIYLLFETRNGNCGLIAAQVKCHQGLLSRLHINVYRTAVVSTPCSHNVLKIGIKQQTAE